MDGPMSLSLFKGRTSLVRLPVTKIEVGRDWESLRHNLLKQNKTCEKFLVPLAGVKAVNWLSNKSNIPIKAAHIYNRVNCDREIIFLLRKMVKVNNLSVEANEDHVWRNFVSFLSFPGLAESSFSCVFLLTVLLQLRYLFEGGKELLGYQC